MQHVDDGQCGLCAHFGESHPQEEKLVQIRLTTRLRRRSWTSAATRSTLSCTSS